MAKIAKNLCSKIYVTDDNPRKESPKKIRKSLTKYLKIQIILKLATDQKLFQRQ